MDFHGPFALSLFYATENGPYWYIKSSLPNHAAVLNSIALGVDDTQIQWKM